MAYGSGYAGQWLPARVFGLAAIEYRAPGIRMPAEAPGPN